MVPSPRPQPPYFVTLNKDLWNENETCIKKLYLFYETEDMKS